VHFSVNWWRTLHPVGPTVADPTRSSGLGGPELGAFFVSLIAFTLLFAWLLALRVRLSELGDRVREAEIAEISQTPRIDEHAPRRSFERDDASLTRSHQR
jgi:hypothetical protein